MNAILLVAAALLSQPDKDLADKALAERDNSTVKETFVEAMEKDNAKREAKLSASTKKRLERARNDPALKPKTEGVFRDLERYATPLTKRYYRAQIEKFYLDYVTGPRR